MVCIVYDVGPHATGTVDVVSVVDEFVSCCASD